MQVSGSSAAGRSALIVFVWLILLCTDGALPGAKAASPSLLARCWSPAALADRPGDLIVRRQPWPAPRVADHGAIHAAASRNRHGVIRRVILPAGVKLVALTFDVGEGGGEITGYDGRIVDYLRRDDVRATFFLGGKWMVNHGERTQQLIADPRFEVASHGWSHRNLRIATSRVLVDEILAPNLAYAAAYRRLAARRCARRSPHLLARVPRRIRLFRFPYGACNARSLGAVADAGLTAIQWDVVTGDPWRAQTAGRIVATVLHGVRPGSIIVAHANGRGWHTAQALPAIVRRLRRRGYRFVTVSELLAAGRPVVVGACYELRPGDNLRYDHPHRHWRRSRRAHRWHG